jgi:hypothetical protein
MKRQKKKPLQQKLQCRSSGHIAIMEKVLDKKIQASQHLKMTEEQDFNNATLRYLQPY